MSRIKLKYVKAWVDRETGRVRQVFRRRGSRQIKLPGLPGSAEFMAAYQQALAESPSQIGAKRTKPGSLDAALVRYYADAAFCKRLSLGTQQLRRPILERWRVQAGDLSLGTL